MNSEQLKIIRKQLGLTQKGLAKLIGVSIRTTQSWEYGEQRVPKATGEYLKQKVTELYPQENNSNTISIDVSDRTELSLEEMAEFCLKHLEEFIKIPGIKLLIDFHRNQAKTELLEKHVILRNQEKDTE